MQIELSLKDVEVVLWSLILAREAAFKIDEPIRADFIKKIRNSHNYIVQQFGDEDREELKLGFMREEDDVDYFYGVAGMVSSILKGA